MDIVRAQAAAVMDHMIVARDSTALGKTGEHLLLDHSTRQTGEGRRSLLRAVEWRALGEPRVQFEGAVLGIGMRAAKPLHVGQPDILLHGRL